MRGKGNVYGSCYTAFANHFWWDDDTDRPYAWLINFSTEGITTSHISMQISVMNNAAELLLAPFLVCRMVADRFAGRKGRLAVESDRRIHHPRRFRLGEHALFVVRGLQSIDFELPQEILGHENVYIRLRPTSDLCSDGSDYANARLNQSASGAALAAEHASSLEYFAIRYNK